MVEPLCQKVIGEFSVTLSQYLTFLAVRTSGVFAVRSIEALPLKYSLMRCDRGLALTGPKRSIGQCSATVVFSATRTDAPRELAWYGLYPLALRLAVAVIIQSYGVGLTRREEDAAPM